MNTKIEGWLIKIAYNGNTFYVGKTNNIFEFPVRCKDMLLSRESLLKKKKYLMKRYTGCNIEYCPVTRTLDNDSLVEIIIPTKTSVIEINNTQKLTMLRKTRVRRKDTLLPQLK